MSRFSTGGVEVPPLLLARFMFCTQPKLMCTKSCSKRFRLSGTPATLWKRVRRILLRSCPIRTRDKTRSTSAGKALGRGSALIQNAAVTKLVSKPVQLRGNNGINVLCGIQKQRFPLFNVGFENRRWGNSSGGSNPSPSAKIGILKTLLVCRPLNVVSRLGVFFMPGALVNSCVSPLSEVFRCKSRRLIRVGTFCVSSSSLSITCL